VLFFFFFFSSRRRHTRFSRDWSSDVCSSDLPEVSTHLELGGSLPLLTLVDHGKLDAALVVKPFFALPPELKWVPLLQEPFKVVRSEERRVGKGCEPWGTPEP